MEKKLKCANETERGMIEALFFLASVLGGLQLDFVNSTSPWDRIEDKSNCNQN